MIPLAVPLAILVAGLVTRSTLVLALAILLFAGCYIGRCTSAVGNKPKGTEAFREPAPPSPSEDSAPPLHYTAGLTRAMPSGPATAALALQGAPAFRGVAVPYPAMPDSMALVTVGEATSANEAGILGTEAVLYDTLTNDNRLAFTAAKGPVRAANERQHDALLLE